MKKIIYILAVGLIFMTGCTGIKSVSKGLENESYLEFIGKPSLYSGGVDVTIDGKNTFNAEVNKGTSKRPKGKVYSMPTGRHSLSVKYNGELIYSKEIFISSQETKQILLP